MKKWKAFDASSWSALLSSLVRVKSTADTNTSAVGQLGEDFAEMAALTSQELAGKQDRASPVSCTIPNSGWKQDETEGYPYYCDLPAPGVTAADRVDVTVAVSGLMVAVQCGLCPTCETLKDVIRLRAASVPVTSIAAGYTIDQGKEQ